MATVADNIPQTEQAYRRELTQTRRLPRLRPETSAPADDVSEEEDEQEDYDDDDEELEADSEEDGLEAETGMETAEAEEQEAEVLAEEEEDELQDEIEADEELMVNLRSKVGKTYDLAGGTLRKEASKKAVEELSKKLAIGKIAGALTVVGLIVTYLIMTGQFIIGNWLGNPQVPKLSFLEIILWFLLTCVILLVLALLFVISIIGVVIALGPVVALSLFGKELVGIVF